MRINYLRPSKSRPKKPIKQEISGVYRCAKCLMIFPSDIKYKRHDCYCEHEFESYERERDGSYGWSFSIPELDEKLKVKAAKDKVRFSDVTIATLEGYLK